MKFRIGDRVKVLFADKLYRSYMHNCLGEVGEIVEYDKYDNTYALEFKNGNNWWFCEDSLQLVYREELVDRKRVLWTIDTARQDNLGMKTVLSNIIRQIEELPCR